MEARKARSPKLYCFCRKPSSDRMVQCDACEEWFHFECVVSIVCVAMC